VVIFGTGGHSHQLQSERAGLIDVDFDLQCIDKIANDPEWMTRFSNAEIMRRAGADDIETITWLMMRGAPQSNVKVLHKHYHTLISNTGAGVLVLD
jgi:protocatechuate 4,5-dioxygenase, beta chain